jgi:hypothetical protein
MTKEAKLKSLIAYAEGLKHRLNSEVPKKHANNVANFKQMLEIDLKKTNQDIEKLRQ